MPKYSLGTDDVAGLRWMLLGLAKEVLGRGSEPVTIDQVVAGARTIEDYLLDQTAKDQLAADASSARAAADSAAADAAGRLAAVPLESK